MTLADVRTREDIMSYLRTHPGCSSADIAKNLGLHVKSVSQYLAHLEEVGQVSLLYIHPRTRRYHWEATE
jgi:predicted ArsR family transcriptional regulator